MLNNQKLKVAVVDKMLGDLFTITRVLLNKYQHDIHQSDNDFCSLMG